MSVVYSFQQETMTRVEQLERQIGRLNPDEFMQLRDWLMEQDSAESVSSIQRDSATQPAVDPLNALRAEFDRELAVLQLPGASEKLRNVFASTPAEIADAANAAGQRKR